MTTAERVDRERAAHVAAAAEDIVDLAFQRVEDPYEAVDALCMAAAGVFHRAYANRDAMLRKVQEIVHMYDLMGQYGAGKPS